MNAKGWGILLALLTFAAALGFYFGYNQGWESAVRTSATSTQEQPAGSQAKALPGYGADSVAIHAAMLGTWENVEDPKFTREFKADGTVVDMYEGDPSATVNATWRLFTAGDTDPDFQGSISSDTTYLKISDASTALFFSVVKAIGNDLQLIYLDRGNTLNFTKVQ